MGHALVIPHTDFSSVATKQVQFKIDYDFDNLLTNFINVSGYTPTSPGTLALRHLTDGLIWYGIWEQIDGLYLLLGTTYDSCKYNWKNPNDYVLKSADNGVSFNLTSEHRINSDSAMLYIEDYNINVDSMHSLTFIKVKHNTTDAYVLPLMSLKGNYDNNIAYGISDADLWYRDTWGIEGNRSIHTA
jgi:hypothetical protein